MLQCLGPWFFVRISNQISDLYKNNAAPSEYYSVELSAAGLGMSPIISIVLRVADPGATETLTTDNLEEVQKIHIGSALLSMPEKRAQDVHRCCNIVHFEVETGDRVTNMEAFGAMLGRIQSFCVEHHVEHLAMIAVRRSCWFSDLIKLAGFKHCDCELPNQHVGSIGVGLQSCMVLSNLPTEFSAGNRSERGHFGNPFIPLDKKPHALSAAPLAVQAPESLRADSLQPRFQTPSPDRTPRKLYCMFWLRRGECDYLQKGCKYLHEMPVDKETRERIGLRKIPEWFVLPQPIIPLFKLIGSPETLSRDSRAPPKSIMLTRRNTTGSKRALSTSVSCEKLTDQPLEDSRGPTLTKQSRPQPSHLAKARIKKAVQLAGAEADGLQRYDIILFRMTLTLCNPHGTVSINVPSYLNWTQRYLAPTPLQLQAVDSTETSTDPQVQGCLPGAATNEQQVRKATKSRTKSQAKDRQGATWISGFSTPVRKDDLQVRFQMPMTGKLDQG